MNRLRRLSLLRSRHSRDHQVNKELTQANIILGHEGVGRENPDYYAIQVMNYILGGGGFSSRTLDSIRNERGLAYSVYSYFSAEKGHGTFELVMQTKNETALEAIRIAKAEIRRMRENSSLRKSFQMRRIILSGAFRCASIPTAKSRISWLRSNISNWGWTIRNDTPILSKRSPVKMYSAWRRNILSLRRSSR